jgi:hypothetical protein
MSALFALLIGIAVIEGGVALDDPVAGAAPADRKAQRAQRVELDDETVGTLPPGGIAIERRIIIRIPMLSRAAPDPRSFAPQAVVIPAPQRASCLSLRAIRGASIADRAGIIFVTTENVRYQATLERGCSPVDFQSGFYLNPAPDGALCVGRDMLHARSGTGCTVAALTRMKGAM